MIARVIFQASRVAPNDWLLPFLVEREEEHFINVCFFSGEWGDETVSKELFLYLLELKTILMPK